MVPLKLPSKGSTPAKPPAGWQPNPNQSSRLPKDSQAATARNRTYFQCSDCPQIIRKLGDLGRHWNQDSTNHRDAWFTERAHMFRRKREGDPHIEYYCVGRSGNTNIWKRCNNQALTDGEDHNDLQSLIDQEGIKYVERDGAFAREIGATRTGKPDSGAANDENHGNTTLAHSNCNRGGTGRRESSRQASFEGSMGPEPSSENDGDGLTTNQDMSVDNAESHDPTNLFDGEAEGGSHSFVNQNNATGEISSLEPGVPTLAKRILPTTRDDNMIRDVMEATKLQHVLEYGKRKPDGDDQENNEAITDPKNAPALSGRNSGLDARRKKNFPNSTESHGIDRPLAQNPYLRPDSSLVFGQPATLPQSSPYARADEKMPQYPSANIFGSLPPHHPPRPGASQNSQQQPSARALEEQSSRGASTADWFPRSGPTSERARRRPMQFMARPGRDARSMSPQERDDQRLSRGNNDPFARGFEAGRRHGRIEERNAAKALKDARARNGFMNDDDEMDENAG